MKSLTNEDDYIHINIPPGAYNFENLNNEIKRILIDEKHYTDSNYPLTIKANFSTLGSIIDISIQGSVITFVPDGSVRNLLKYNKTIMYEEYNLSPNPVDILSIILFDNIFLECNIDQGIIFKSKRSRICHKFTMDVNSGYKYIRKLRSKCNGR